jgi:hypothetical protein
LFFVLINYYYYYLTEEMTNLMYLKMWLDHQLLNNLEDLDMLVK